MESLPMKKRVKTDSILEQRGYVDRCVERNMGLQSQAEYLAHRDQRYQESITCANLQSRAFFFFFKLIFYIVAAKRRKLKELPKIASIFY